MRKHLTFIFTLLLLTSCGGKKGEFRLSGQLDNLDQANLFIFSEDGSMDGIDTIHVVGGKFTYSHLFDGEDGVFTILYPNYSMLTVFASSGDELELNGDARQLSMVEVSGNEDNERYTRFRLDNISSSEDSIKNVARAIVREAPSSALSLYLERTVLPKPRFEVGNRMPAFKLQSRQGKTIHRDDFKGKRLLIAFWANWMPGSSDAIYRTRRMRKEFGENIEAISYCLDVDTVALSLNERRDSITWYSVCDKKSFASPLVEKLGVQELPYYVLVDTNYKALVCSANWSDVERILNQWKKE